jgi:hypothetical protein
MNGTGMKILSAICRKSLFLSLLLCSYAAPAADLNVLIIGSTTDSTAETGVNGTSAPFSPTVVGSELDKILAGSGRGTVNVTVENRGYPHSLAAWFHYPLPAGVETTTRWPNLRGELGTQWDYIILIGDPYTMEYLPGLYAQGVGTIAEEVAKSANPAEVILLMPWPAASSSSTVAHYKEVVYRAGRSGGLKVAPAGLAWQQEDGVHGTTHPTTNGAYISAASIYSSIFNESAGQSTYSYNDTLADSVSAVVNANKDAQQYTGNFSFQNPFLPVNGKSRRPQFTPKGTSTEDAFAVAVIPAATRAGIKIYNSGTVNPLADVKAWRHSRKQNYSVGWGQISYVFEYQDDLWNYKTDASGGNDAFNRHVFLLDMKLAASLRETDNNARVIPTRLLWSQLHQSYPQLNPQADGFNHLNANLNTIAATYMYTLYSGRCPVDPQPSPVTTDWLAQKIGYETAWRLGHCTSRAPGFKVTPSAADRLKFKAGETESMTVQFILPPRENVTVNVTVSDPSMATVSPSTLTFTPQNYNTPQQVVVTGALAAGSGTFHVQYATTSQDPVYDGLDDSWEYETQAAMTAVIYEPFQRAGSGSLSNQKTSGIGLKPTWGVNSNLVVQSDGLSYGSLPVTGKSISNNTSRRLGADVLIDGALGAAGLLADGDEVWFSLLHKIAPSNNANAQLSFALATDPLGSGVPSALSNANGAGVGFRIVKGDELRAATWVPGATPQISEDGVAVDLVPAGAQFGRTVLIVGKVTWGATSADLDKVELYLPNTNLELGPVVTTVSATIDQSALDTMSIGGPYSAAGTCQHVDEIRFGENYTAVIGDVAPPTAALGTPHSWLQSYGITNNYDAAELADPDNDGSPNWEEYLAGTDPKNPASTFKITSLVMTSGNVELVWHGSTNSGLTTDFIIYRSTDLVNWEEVGRIARSPSGTNIWPAPRVTGVGSVFYRIGIAR